MSAETDSRPARSAARARPQRRSGARVPRERSWPAPAAREPATLAGYRDAGGRAREVVVVPGPARTAIVLDRDRSARGDARLVAHLAADEPAENAALACLRFLQAPAQRRGCRTLSAAQLRELALAGPPGEGAAPAVPVRPRPVAAGNGETYELRAVDGGMTIPELRWWRSRAHGGRGGVVSVRDAVAALESYEPVRSLTACALARHEGSAEVSVVTLRAELARVLHSPIVLNRALREAVLRTLAAGEASMSANAIRCGRVKRDGRGALSGETSWLARRLGIAPEGGETHPTPWIHSDVLALIAREGLGIAPREVEL